jgi:hypothetical protein
VFLFALSLNQAKRSCATWIKEENLSLLIPPDIFYAIMLMIPHNKVEPFWYDAFKDTIPFWLTNKDSLVLMQHQHAEPGIVHFALTIIGPFKFDMILLKGKVKARIFYVTIP